MTILKETNAIGYYDFIDTYEGELQKSVLATTCYTSTTWEDMVLKAANRVVAEEVVYHTFDGDEYKYLIVKESPDGF